MKQDQNSTIDEHIPPRWWMAWDFEKGEWTHSDHYKRLEEAYSWACSDLAACTYARITLEMLEELKTDCVDFDFEGWRSAMRANLEIKARRRFAAELENNPKAAWEYLQATDPQLSPTTKLANKDGEPLKILIVGADPDKLKL